MARHSREGELLMAKLYAVVCRNPTGHETIIRSLVFGSAREAERAAAKRDRLPTAVAHGFRHRVALVVENPRQTGPSDKYLLAETP